MAAIHSSNVGERADARAEPVPSGWIVFAALMLVMSGGFAVVYGLAALLNSPVITVGGRGVIVWDFTVWGWVMLVLGVLMLAVAWGLFAMKPTARWTAIILAVMGSIFQMGLITAFPLWSIMMITLNVVVIYQLTARWDRG